MDLPGVKIMEKCDLINRVRWIEKCIKMCAQSLDIERNRMNPVLIPQYL